MDEYYSADALEKLRNPFTQTNYALNAWPLREVATANVDQTTFIPPITELVVSNTSGGWLTAKAGQMVVIHNPDGEEVLTGVVRKTPTVNRLYIDARVSGDAGRSVLTQRYIGDDARVVIYDYMPLWTLFSAIRSGVFYKSFDRAYINEGTLPPPQCNLGSWRQAFVDPINGTATLTFRANESSYDLRGGALTYQFAPLPAGATLVGGALNSGEIEVRFEPGFYLIACTVFNIYSGSHTAYRPVWINTIGGAFDALSETAAVEIVSDRNDLRGRDMSFKLHGQTNDIPLPDGGAVFFSEYRAPDVEYAVHQYAGLIASVRRAYENDHPLLDIETKGPGSLLQEIACAPQAFIESASPANWSEILRGLGTAQNFIWYILHYHCPNALAIFDFIPQYDESVRRRGQQSTSAASIGAMCDEIVAQMGGIFGSASDGSLYVSRNQSSEEVNWREAWTAGRIILTDDDVVGDVAITENFRPQVGQLTCDGWCINYTTGETTALRSTWGKSAQAQGINKSSGPVFMVTDQNDLNRKTGQEVAIQNNATAELRLPVNPALDIFDPARDWNAWYVWLNLDSTYDPRGVGFSGAYTVKGIERTWRKLETGLIKDVTFVLVPLTTGLPGETVPILTDNLETDPDWSWNISITYPEPSVYFDVPYPFGNYNPDPDAEPLFPTKIVMTNCGVSLNYEGGDQPRVWRGMIDISKSRVRWENVSNGLPSGGGVNMAIRGYAADPYNPARKFLLTQNGLYECRNLWATSPTWVQRATYAEIAHSRYFSGPGGPEKYLLGCLRMSTNRRGYMVVRIGTSRYVSYSTNYGRTWKESVIDTGSWPEESYPAPGMMSATLELSHHNVGGAGWLYVLRDVTIETVAPDTYRWHGRIFKSVNYGRTWSELSTITLPDYYTPVGDGRNLRLYIPFTRRDGSPNLNNSAKELYAYQPGAGMTYRTAFPYDSPSVLFSDDDGDTWSPVFEGSSTYKPWSSSERGVWAFPHDGSIIYTVVSRHTTDGSRDTNGDARVARSINGFTSAAYHTVEGQPDWETPFNRWTTVGFGLNPNVIAVYEQQTDTLTGTNGGVQQIKLLISGDGGSSFFASLPDDWPDDWRLYPGMDAFEHMNCDTPRFVEFDMTDYVAEV